MMMQIKSHHLDLNLKIIKISAISLHQSAILDLFFKEEQGGREGRMGEGGQESRGGQKRNESRGARRAK